MKRIIIVLIFFFLIPASSFAEIYRCVDENGEAIFTTQPGPGCILLPRSVGKKPESPKIPPKTPQTYRNNKLGFEISYEQLFPKSQQKQMGLQKLSESEKEALRVHVEGLLLKAMFLSESSGAVTTHQGVGIYASVGEGHWVKKNVDSGTYMILEDGSLWKIDPFDKFNTMSWFPASSIIVTESSSGSPGYDYLLINTDDGENAHAKYMGRE